MDELAPSSSSLLSIAEEYGSKIPESARKLIAAGEEISKRQPAQNSLVYNHSVFCFVGLPRKATNSRTFERRNNEHSIKIVAGELWLGNEWVQQPLPFGAMSRLLLMRISTMSITKESPVVDIGNSGREILKKMGFGTGGREHARLWQHMHALAACEIRFGYNGSTTDFMRPIKKISSEWDGRIILSDDFFTSLATHAVPLDQRALQHLAGSSFCLDIYVWLAYRLHRIKKGGLELSWYNLQCQFGHEYSTAGYKCGHKDFAKEFTRALKKVRTVYPNANIDYLPSGLVLHNSPPPVLPSKAKGRDK